VPTLELDGTRLRYIRLGTGPAVLLIQGAGLVGEGWRPQIDGLSAEFSVFAPDNRGTGGSAAGERAVTIEAMARDALAIMDAEGVPHFHVVGHSMGGLIAQAVALAARDRVLSLALLCTFVRGSEGARLSPAMLATALRMRLGTRRMRRNAFLELIMPAAYLENCDRDRLARSLTPLFGYDLASQPAFVMRQVRAMARYDASARWTELAGMPTLVVSAAHDRIALPTYGRTLASLIDGARYVELPDAAHGVTIQSPEAVNTLLRGHITAADAARRSRLETHPGAPASP
jgi:pimeloyl-ACP methyl ester carboxylesterase